MSPTVDREPGDFAAHVPLFEDVKFSAVRDYEYEARYGEKVSV